MGNCICCADDERPARGRSRRSSEQLRCSRCRTASPPGRSCSGCTRSWCTRCGPIVFVSASAQNCRECTASRRTSEPADVRRNGPPAGVASAAVRTQQGSLSCPHCGAVPDAAFLDSHIESCRLRKRNRERQGLASADHEMSSSNASEAPDQPDPRRRVSAVRDPVLCEHCNEYIHPAILPAHRAACRPGGGSEPASVAEEDLCIICFEKKRTIAFVPCGHWTCCETCTPRVTECPVCRSSIEKRVVVDHASASLSVCPVCHVHVHPTFLQGHREVCRLRMRQQRDEEQQEAEAGAADGSGGPQGEAALCTLCNKHRREVAILPCGHYCMCRLCASTVTVCPLCCTNIRSTVPLYT